MLALPFLKTAMLCISLTLLASETCGEVRICEDCGNCFGGPSEDINLWGMLHRNVDDLIAILMLTGIAAYSLELILDRSVTLAIARRRSIEYQVRVGSALYNGRFEEAASLSGDYLESPVAFAVHAFVRSNPRRLSLLIKPSMGEWYRSTVIKSAEIKRRLWTLGAIGWSVPLVGILYASIRVTNTFLLWHSAGGTSFASLANEIAHAAWGITLSLIIAVPVICGHKYLSAQSETVVLEMQSLSLAIIDQLLERQATSLKSSCCGQIAQGFNTNSTERVTR